MAWRKAGSGPAAGTVARLEGYAAEYETAAAVDGRAAQLLANTQSYLAMIGMAGPDAEAVADIFGEFARLDWAVWCRGVA